MADHPLTAEDLPCVHRRQLPVSRRGLPVLTCIARGRCTLGPATPGVVSCDGCRQRRALPTGRPASARSVPAAPATRPVAPLGPAFFRAYPCPHRGEAVEQLRGKSCMIGDALVEIRACAIHGRCSSNRFDRPQPDGIQPCGTCNLLPRD